MKYLIEVRRKRSSVTQGSAIVSVNGIDMVEFGDEMVLIHEGQKYYGDCIGGWASVTPDESFIKGMLFHPYDGYYRLSEKFRKMLDKAIGQKEVV